MKVRFSEQCGGVLVIVLVMLIPITLFAVNLMTDSRLLWLSTFNYKSITVSDSLLNNEINRLLNHLDEVDSGMSSKLIHSRVGVCPRSHLANSSNAKIKCEYKTLIVEQTSALKRYVYVNKSFLSYSP